MVLLAVWQSASSCGMMVNGKPKLACKTFLRDYSGHMRIEPLANFRIEQRI